MAECGHVHWVGTGLSTGSGLQLLSDRTEIVLWGRTARRAEETLARFGPADRGEARQYTPGALAATVRPGDAVVSMLPMSHHAEVLRVCLEAGAHFACASYLSAELTRLAEPCRRDGLVVLVEAGLDPGIDHLLAHDLFDRAAAVIGTDTPTEVEFTSYCGGIPAVPNDFRYRFAWAPRSVLTALRGTARFIEHGAERVTERPWETTQPHVLKGERFEVYPNRDSIPYLAQYRVPEAWHAETFVRGTLRPDGWSRAWQPVFKVLQDGNDDQVTALAEDLARRYPATSTDRDRVVLAATLRVQARDGRTWSGNHLLDIEGDDSGNAMARTVSITLACGVIDILAGATSAGLHRATSDPGTARRWLAFLADQGIRITSTEAAS